MEEIFTHAVIWFIIGLAFFLLEFAIPGFILFFFGCGAWLVAILCLFLDIPINMQLLLFLGVSVVTAALFRNWVKKKLGMYKAPDEMLEDEFIGRTALAETAISPGASGKVEFRGTSWDASSDEEIRPGERVTIIGNKSILLIVKRNTTL